MKKNSKSKISETYGQALFEAADEAKNLDVVFQDISRLSEILPKLPELSVLKNPSLTNSEQNELLEILKKSLELSETTYRFLITAVQNKHFDTLENIFKNFQNRYYIKKNILMVEVETAQALSSSQNKKLQEKLEKYLKQKVIISYLINPKVLGGLSVCYNSVRIDDTLAGKLTRLEKAMKGS